MTFLNQQLLLPFLLNRTNSFTHAQQIHCLDSLGWHPILYWIQSNSVPTVTFTRQPNGALNRNNRGFFPPKFMKTLVHKYVIFTWKFELFYNLWSVANVLVLNHKLKVVSVTMNLWECEFATGHKVRMSYCCVWNLNSLQALNPGILVIFHVNFILL